MKKFNNIKELFFSEVALLDIRHNQLAFLFGCVALSPLIGFLPSITPMYYAMLVVVVIKMVSSHWKIDKVSLFFIIACALSIVLASPPSFFKSWGRLGLFVLVFMAVSPLLQSKEARKFRKSVLQLTLIVALIVSLVSFVFYFLGINYMVRYASTEFMGIAGRFGGLTRHSMILGPISAIAATYCSYRALSTKNNLYWLLAVPCIACTMFSASRSSFLAAILGFFVMLYANSNSKKKLMKRLFWIVLVVYASFPLWSNALSGLSDKQQNNIEMRGSAMGSREGKWENRFDEFKSSPIWGVGFCACDPQNTSDYMKSTGTVETGSSWLSVLSMTGVLGFIPFCLLFVLSLVRLWIKKGNNIENSLFLGLMTLSGFHMMAEGYVLAGGNLLCVLTWLIISCSYDCGRSYKISSSL